MGAFHLKHKNLLNFMKNQLNFIFQANMMQLSFISHSMPLVSIALKLVVINGFFYN